MEVRRGNHTVYTINYHFVWCPKYRHAILDRIEAPLEQSIRDAAGRYGYDILSLHIAPDHVHLFLSAHPKHAPSEIVGRLRASPPERCGNSTDHCWNGSSGAVVFGNARFTWGRRAK